MNWYLLLLALIISFAVFYYLLRERIFELLFSPGVLFFIASWVILYLLFLKIPWWDLGKSLAYSIIIIIILSGISRWKEWECDPLKFGITGILLLVILIYFILFYEWNSNEVTILKDTPLN